jgi:beta-lactamase superfamily II metal-dependent hydrolase
VTGSTKLTVKPGSGATAPLQIHYLDVGQGDAAIMLTPGGQTVMFDDGPGNCTALVAALRQLNVTKLDYHIASHYHSDHIGCAQPVFSAFPLSIGLDRGGSYTTATYTSYASAVGGARQTATIGSSITLDQATGSPVRIDIVAMDSGLSDENDRSVVAVVHFGGFDAEFGGDLTDGVEGAVAPRMSRVEVYKVHHHGSATATSTAWLSAIMPKIGIVSVGNGNSYHHPTQSALDRLHNAGVKTYWTEAGSGATPNTAWDVVAGTVTIEVQAGAGQFTVRWNGGSETYTIW